ncbi:MULTISPECIES: hypothetical protein [unclassified Mesorhizobium]|uniref:hypothetical protein n=1 Tax=unclassified Mesorhizobium TaxID=325217 RepID=UPI0016795EC2|nr:MULTISPECIES: hypothetical protein [unclassified Mesorhizobium]
MAREIRLLAASRMPASGAGKLKRGQVCLRGLQSDVTGVRVLFQLLQLQARLGAKDWVDGLVGSLLHRAQDLGRFIDLPELRQAAA